MSNCSFTRNIPSNQCIGDSLRTINSNFSALNAGICDIPILHSSDITVKPFLDPLGFYTMDLAVNASPIAIKQFSYSSSFVPVTSLSFSDGTSTPGYTFPYIESSYDPKPIGTFEAFSNNTGFPQITLFWTGNAPLNSVATVFATNSSTSTSKGPIWFNDTVDSFYRDGDILYVGGQFTTVGGIDTKKIAVINLKGGAYHTSLGWTGSIESSPFELGGNLGKDGTVNFITKTTINGNELILVGGSFKSSSKGRGFVVYNKSTQATYPFYFNGELRDFLLIGTELYVVGEFDFCAYGIDAGSSTSGSRVYGKSIAKIELERLLISPNACIDTSFGLQSLELFKGPTSLYCIKEQTNTIYLGGSFRVKVGNQTTYQNLIAVGINCLPVTSWKIIVDGPVHTITIDPVLSYMYIGGNFSKIATQEDYYNIINPLTENDEYYNAAAFSLVDPVFPELQNWKPKFNGPIHKMILHEEDNIDSYVYCIGSFTEVNNTAVGNIAAIIKKSATYNNEGSLPSSWPIYLQSGSSPNTNALLKYEKTLLVGGNFTSINGVTRYRFAKIAGVNESISVFPQQKMNWDIGGKICSQNQSFAFDFNNTPIKRTETAVGPYGLVTKTTFEPLTEGFKGLTKNQLCRFFIKRPGNIGTFQNFTPTDDTYQKDVFLLGWTIDFNNKQDK